MLKKVGLSITKDKLRPEKIATTHLPQNQQITDHLMMDLQIELKKWLKSFSINQLQNNLNTHRSCMKDGTGQTLPFLW